VLARAHQDTAWAREQLANQLRSLLREFYPAAIEAFAGLSNGGLTRPESRTVLAAAPNPTAAAKVTLTQLRALLRRSGRQRNIERRATAIQHAFRAPALRQPTEIETAMSEHLAAVIEQTFYRHPDAKIITSHPGLSTISGARLLGEIGDDPHRFTDARALKAYAGSAPVTRASGKTRLVLHRRAKNKRIAAVGYTWAFAALTASPGAHAHYHRRKQRSGRHPDALRHLFNRLLGCLHHCPATRQHYNEALAFPTPEAAPKPAAA
jgi:transposase